MFQNVVIGWFARRALELGGLFGFLYTMYLGMPPYAQAAVGRVLSGQAEQEHYIIATGAIGLALWGYAWSFISTKKPQVVTADAKQIPIKPNTHAASRIEAEAAVAPKPKTLWERLTNR